MNFTSALETLPILISYPRSGSHWINNLIQIYFNRPKFRDEKPIIKGNNFLFCHDHDINSTLKIPHNKVLYLYRNPVNVLFSLQQAERYKNIDQHINNIKKHYRKYLLNDNFLKIKYEDCKSDIVKEFKKIIIFFDKTDVDYEKLNKANEVVTKEKLINFLGENKYLNRYMLTKDYEIQRNQFKERYQKYILSEFKEFF